MRLHLNENFFIEKEWSQNILREAIVDIDPREYSPAYGATVRSALANFHNIPEERILIGNGAVQIIDYLTTTFTQPGSTNLIIQPTFGLYSQFIERKGGKSIDYFLNADFSLNLPPLLDMIDKSTGIIFLSSPNNPPGNQFPKETMIELLESVSIPVVIDEAYSDFAPYTALHWEYPNLISVRSFSKVAAAAGIRIGYVVAQKDIIERITTIQSRFSVNLVAQRYIVKILENYDYIQNKIMELKNERTNLFNRLQHIDGIQVYPSDATFFLLRILNKQAKNVVEQLKEDGILVSDRSNEKLLENCIRIAIGTRSMNDTFVNALESALI